LNAWLRSRFHERVFKLVLESGLTCPNRDGTAGNEGCIFCHPDSLKSNTALNHPIRPIREQIREGLHYIGKRHGAYKVISHFGSGSNTYAPADVLEPLLNDAIDNPAVVGLAISTRPDCISDDHLRLLSEFSARTLLWVELGLQSSHDSTLRWMERGHTAAQFADACERLHSRGIMTCAHVILGLSEETPEMMIETARFLIKARVWGVKIHNLHVLKGTKLGRMYDEGQVNLPSLETYAGWAVDFLEALSPEMVIHRFQGHSRRSLTVAPLWSINKLAVFNAVEAELVRRDTWQGKRF